MNHNLTPMHPFIHAANLRFLFVSFVVVSNWLVFSVLTAAVSDKMLSATTEHSKQDEADAQATERAAAAAVLVTLFHAMDKNNDGYIDEAEFLALLNDQGVCLELRKATNLPETDLKAMFSFLSTWREGAWKIDYRAYVEWVTCSSNSTVAQVMHRVSRHMRTIEKRVNTGVSDILVELRDFTLIFKLV